jgi:site-specific DNA recombinase
MKLVGYIRVSSESQEFNTSLQDQRERLEAYAKAFNYELVEVFTEIGSGKNTSDRPQFQAALEAIKNGADGIISTKLDRIARNARDVLALVEDTLQPDNKHLILLDLNVDTSNPQGKMILTIMAAVAELERNVINDRTQGGRKAKAANGGYAYGSPAFGQTAIDGELVTDEKEAEIIDLMRRHRKSGKSYRAIADYLNKHGYPTKRGGDNRWTHSVVKNVLDRTKARSA